MVVFSCVAKFADIDEPPLDKEGNIAKWMQNLTDFTGLFFKRTPAVDLRGLLLYLVRRMRDDKAYTLAYVVHSLVKTLFGWQDLSVDQLRADQLPQLAAGYVLLVEGRQQAQKKNLKAVESLEKVFWPEQDEFKIAFSLVEQLAQMAQFV